VDNIAVGCTPFASGISADGVSFTVRIVQGQGKTVNQNAGITAELDGVAVTPLEVTQDGDYVVVKYSQSPECFPRNRVIL
jgi:hypothetical protein